MKYITFFYLYIVTAFGLIKKKPVETETGFAEVRKK